MYPGRFFVFPHIPIINAAGTAFSPSLLLILLSKHLMFVSYDEMFGSKHVMFISKHVMFVSYDAMFASYDVMFVNNYVMFISYDAKFISKQAGQTH